MEILSVENLSFCYGNGDFELAHINLSVEKGDIMLFCGPCGCGKTTLLRLLKVEMMPKGEQKGRINCSYNSDNIGYLLQNPESQIVCRTVEEELAFGAENLGMEPEKIGKSIAEITAYLGIEKILHASTMELSGGQKQMVNLAALLMMKPKILILDEPLSQLDPVSAWEFMSLVKKLREELDMTFLVAEHNLDFFLKEADKVIYMEQGRILFDGEKQNFIKKVIQEKREFYQSLPETVKLFVENGKNIETETYYPLTLRELKKTNALDISPVRAEEKRGTPEERVKITKGFFRYEKHGKDILSNVNLTLYKEKVYSLVGGNGVGKSTLFSIISGYRKLYTGKIDTKGKTAVLSQNPAYAFLMDTLMEDLLKIASKEKIEELIYKYDFFHDISDFLPKNPLDLSGGQMQKAAIFKMFLSGGEILLFDEPVKALDGYEKNHFKELLLQLKSFGKTIVFITHDLEFAEDAADECMMLFDGKIIAQDMAEDFFAENSFYTTLKGRIKGDGYGKSTTD